MIGNWTALAQASVNDLGSRFRSDGATTLDRLMVGLLILGSIALALWLFAMYYNWRENNGSHSPGSLFRQLCHAHQLDFRSCRLLKRLAHCHQLTHPARLFLEPERFNSGLSPALKQHQADLLKLRERLFVK